MFVVCIINNSKVVKQIYLPNAFLSFIKMTKQLYELHITCPKTGLFEKIDGPFYDKTPLVEDLEMYRRHIPPSFADFSIAIRPLEDPLTFSEKLFRDGSSHTCCYNAEYQSADTCNLLWSDMFSNRKEKHFVMKMIDDLCVKIYKKNPKLNASPDILHGSLWDYGSKKFRASFE